MADKTIGALDQDTCGSCARPANKGTKRWDCVMCCEVFHANCRQGLVDKVGDQFCRPCWKDHHGSRKPARIIGRKGTK